MRGSSWYRVGDSRVALKDLPIKPSCIITSPPYFDVRDYGVENQMGRGQSLDQFMLDIGSVFRWAFQAAQKNATLWIIADAIRRDGELIPLPNQFAQAAATAGWRLQSMMIWQKDRTYPWIKEGRLRKIHETIVLLTKGSPKLRIDRLREIDDVSEWWQRYPERYNPHGRAPADVWVESIPVQGSWGNPFLKHECPLPPALVERMVELSTAPGQWVLDPFAGTGVVAATAAVMARNGYAIDMSRDFEHHFNDEVVPAVREWWVGRQLERRAIERKRAAFFRANIALRLLKFARLLQDALVASGIAVDGAWVRSGVLRSVTPWVAPRITILVPALTDADDVLKQSAEVIKKAPLSKFGVVAAVDVVETASFRSSTRASVYFSSGPKLDVLGDATGAEFAKLCSEAPAPLIASTLRIEAADVLKVRTRYWRAGRGPSYLSDVLEEDGNGRRKILPKARAAQQTRLKFPGRAPGKAS